jgi:hypothetical protein
MLSPQSSSQNDEDNVGAGVVLPAEQEGHPSPFLPGTNIVFAWDSVMLGTWKTCPKLFWYTMIKGYRPKDESVHLRFGIEYHRALQDYDSEKAIGNDYESSLRTTLHGLLIRTADWRPDHKYKNRENLLRTVIWYLEKFRDDPAVTVKLSDGRPATEVSFRFELDWGPKQCFSMDYVEHLPTGNGHYTQPYLLCGHLDRIVSFADSIFVMDHKTTKSQPSSWYYTQYEPDNQMTLYTLAGQVVLNSPIKGVIISAAQVLQETSDFGRGLTYRTPEQIGEWLDGLKFWFAQQEACAVADHWPMNDKSCNSYRSQESESIGCPFRLACSKQESVREAFLNSNYDKLEEGERWNPLQPR